MTVDVATAQVPNATTGQSVVLWDDACARSFEPFATTRPLSEMRVGALLIRERWVQRLRAPAEAFVSGNHLASFAEFDAPRAARGLLSAGTIVVNSRAVPMLAEHDDHVRQGDCWRIAGRVAAVRLRTAISADHVTRPDFDLSALDAGERDSIDIDGVWLDDVWDITRHLQALLLADIPVLGRMLSCAPLQHAQTAQHPVIIGDHPVLCEVGAIVEPYAVFDTQAGPVLLRSGSVVHAFTRVIGPCYVGQHSSVIADRIAGCAIGDVCRVHGELSATVMIGHANKGHDGFVGHSVIGRWVNLGAGTITSNLKNTYGTVALWTPHGLRDTGLQFLGTYFGDHAKTGIGLRLTTGCVLGAGANVMDAMPPKVVAPFSWGTAAPYAVFALDKFLLTAERVMGRRQVALDDAQRACLSAAFDDAAAHEYWPSR